MNHSEECGESTPIVHSTGPWPFITRHAVLREGREDSVRSSRNHRKGLVESEIEAVATRGIPLLRCLWMPGQLNWWIGLVFSAGAALFMLGSVLVLEPTFAREWSLTANSVNAVFFAGSIPFTIAAYLQLFQAANAGEFTAHRESTKQPVRLIGWRPREIGWLSCALQFAGTILFNVNTFDAMLPGLNWFRENLTVWIPNVVGSVLFLLSGHLAFIETCHAHWAWKPGSISWWITFINLLGCIAFMISALFAFVPAHAHGWHAATISVAFTLVGGLCFLLGSLLMLPETALAGRPNKEMS